ncbi:hypothetical protein BKA65DRAFT_476006 [Rhexocercosporidium sp. MPI-PUGE-AT-0058]|nr:hypothetical protein BKA65DRAFT_476006 [Rhexocercosporidium sp. MPI-PUGE-AT-0058]
MDESDAHFTKYGKDISDPRLRQLFPFIKETSDKWLKPLGIHLGKSKSTEIDLGQSLICSIEAQVNGMVPSKDYADILATFYLDNVEQLYRTVHILTFQRKDEKS